MVMPQQLSPSQSSRHASLSEALIFQDKSTVPSSPSPGNLISTAPSSMVPGPDGNQNTYRSMPGTAGGSSSGSSVGASVGSTGSSGGFWSFTRSMTASRSSPIDEQTSWMQSSKMSSFIPMSPPALVPGYDTLLRKGTPALHKASASSTVMGGSSESAHASSGVGPGAGFIGFSQTQTRSLNFSVLQFTRLVLTSARSSTVARQVCPSTLSMAFVHLVPLTPQNSSQLFSLDKRT
mmetsp:Transcript_24287/g.45944  ORF Transcript_24287/g.45944 Transcript_24287/m.45944 type:complete len:235 (+) Transcript_24287:2276-2980(+)